MRAASPSFEVKVLRVSCSRCGHVREFDCGGRLSPAHLESISLRGCSECGAVAECVFGFFCCAADATHVLERLPEPCVGRV